MGVKIVHKETGEVLWSGEGNSLSGAYLGGANLRGANLRGAKLLGSNLAGADLEGSNLEGASLWAADLSGAKLGGANLREANLMEADLSGAYLWGAKLRRANLESANLRGADLSGADLRGARVKNACFEDANMSGCRKSWFWGWLGIKKVPSEAQLGVAPRAALLGCADVSKAKLGCAPGVVSKVPQASEMAGILELREALQKLRGLAPANKLAQMELGLEQLEQLKRVLPELRDEAVISKTKEEASLLEAAVRREVLTCQKQEDEARASLLWKEAELLKSRLAAPTSEARVPDTSPSQEGGTADDADPNERARRALGRLGPVLREMREEREAQDKELEQREAALREAVRASADLRSVPLLQTPLGLAEVDTATSHGMALQGTTMAVRVEAAKAQSLRRLGIVR